MTVNQPRQTPARAGARSPAPAKPAMPGEERSLLGRIFRKRVIALLAVAAAIVLAWQYWIMPWIVRGRVEAALGGIGITDVHYRIARATLWVTELRDIQLGPDNRIDRVDVRYSLNDLSSRQVKSIQITGAHFSADPKKWPIEKTKAGPKPAGLKLPFEVIRVIDSDLELASGQKSPLTVELTRVGGQLSFHADSSIGHGINATGTIDPVNSAGIAHLQVERLPSDLVAAIIKTFVAHPPVEIQGVLDGDAKITWQSSALSGQGTLQIAAADAAGGATGNASDAKLSLSRGVFDWAAKVGQPDQKPSLSIDIKTADLATAELSAQGVSGSVELSNLNPPATPAGQKLNALRLKVGQLDMTNGTLEFEVTSTGEILVKQSRWDWAGGEVAASDVQIPRQGPTRVTVHLRDVELREVLSLFAKEKASGDGRINGDLPVTIDGSKLTFGDGRLTSLQGGQVQIKDAEAVAPAAEAAAHAAKSPSQSDQIKHNIIEALQDFQYDRLTAQLRNEPEGLYAYVRLIGHGRAGAKQGVDYELRVAGIDKLLRSYTQLKTAVNNATPGGESGKVNP